MATIGEFLIDRIYSSGAYDGFGVPGDYVLGFYDKVCKSKIRLIGCTAEGNAGYAADAYARINGMGLVIATYCVGGFSLMNSIACAYAEKSPVLFVSGSPGVKERKQDLWLHHMVRTFECQHEVMQKVTCASAVLDNSALAGYEIDRVLDAIKHYRQPGYIELPRDMVDVPISYDFWSIGTPPPTVSDEINLNEALEEAVEWINKAEKPVILAGVEIARYGLGKQLIKFAQSRNIPVATTLLGKSVVNERHPLSLGVYCGGLSQGGAAEEAINNSDCIIALGVLMTDVHFGFSPTKILRRNMILSTCQDMQIRNHSYKNVLFSDFFNALVKSGVKMRSPVEPRHIDDVVFVPERGKKLTTKRLFEKIKTIVKDNMAIVADVGDSLFGAADLDTNCNHFLSPAFYTTMGFSIPGALGVQIADKSTRPIVIVGDGAFQMTAAELSTIGRNGLNPIVFVLNNQGYLTERMFQDGSYNEIANWNYDKYPEMIGYGFGIKVTTEDELEDAVNAALVSNKLTLINAVVDKKDATPAMKRVIGNLASKGGFK